ncbi:MAG: hypothetical protein ACP5T3_00420 [Candidatus Micrarchaeia archaeon]
MLLDIGSCTVSIDSREDADLHFVSHAHSDHTAGVRNYSVLLASEATKDILEAKGKKGISLAASPSNVKLLNAGHVLGSKQLFAEDTERGYDVVYTGDYQTDDPLLAEKIETRHADIAIMDSTYPYPNLHFEDKNEVIIAMQHYARMKLEKGSVIFRAYSLGRAQEIIRIYNEIGIVPVVSGEIARISRIYEKYGVHLVFSEYDGSRLPNSNFLGIFTSSDFCKVTKKFASESRRKFTAVATGWAKLLRFDTDVQFALSDHADFRQAVQYVEATSPKLVLTVGAGAVLLAAKLKGMGYEARPFDNCACAQLANVWQPISNLSLIR